MFTKKECGRFWEPGFSVFRNTLAVEEHERLAPLKKELKTTAEPEKRIQVKKAIAAVKAEYRQKRKDANRSLFLKT